MAFKKGDRVQTKVRSKTAVPRQGVIVRAVEGDKKHTWEVQFDDKATGQLEIKTCKMMMHPPAAPTTRNDALQASVIVPATNIEEVYTLISTSGNPASCTGTALNEAAVSEVVIENELGEEEQQQVENEEPPPLLPLTTTEHLQTLILLEVPPQIQQTTSPVRQIVP
jgi:hypothetical protein